MGLKPSCPSLLKAQALFLLKAESNVMMSARENYREKVEKKNSGVCFTVCSMSMLAKNLKLIPKKLNVLNHSEAYIGNKIIFICNV